MYILQMGRTGAIKVGRSSNVGRRKCEIQTGCPYEIKVLIVVKGAGWRERRVHQQMKHFRLRGQKGEWFSEAAIGSIPDDIYNKITMETVEMMNSDWWRETREPGAFG